MFIPSFVLCSYLVQNTSRKCKNKYEEISATEKNSLCGKQNAELKRHPLTSNFIVNKAFSGGEYKTVLIVEKIFY